MFIIEMFRQAFHTYNQNWKKLLFFSVGIGLAFDILTKYIITFWGYRILAVPFTPSSSIKQYVFTHLSTAFSPLVYLLALLNSVLYVVAPIFFILPILYLLIYPELCQSLTPLEIFKKTAPYRKSIALVFLFLLITKSLYTFIDAAFPFASSFFQNFYNSNYLLAFLAIFIAVFVEGMQFFIVKNNLAVLPTLQAVCKIFFHRFFSTLLLVSLMRSCYYLLIVLFLPSLSAPEVFDDHITFFIRLVLDEFFLPLYLYPVYYALCRSITKKETNITLQ